MIRYPGRFAEQCRLLAIVEADPSRLGWGGMVKLDDKLLGVLEEFEGEPVSIGNRIRAVRDAARDRADEARRSSR